MTSSRRPCKSKKQNKSLNREPDKINFVIQNQNETNEKIDVNKMSSVNENKNESKKEKKINKENRL